MNVSRMTARIFKSITAAALVLAATDVTFAQSGVRQSQSRTMMKKGQATGTDKRMTARVGLDGYCPVCIIDARKWEKGNPRISSTFDGLTYYFPSTGLKTKFDRNPQRYVPALNGDCIVCLEKAGKRVPGSIYHAALHNSRLYLFPSDKEKQAFGRSPEAFEKTDLAANGECIVCLAKMNKHVPGSPEHTVVHQGLRYLFPSAKEADMFRKDPAQFVSAAMKMQGDRGQMIKTGLPASKAGMITVSGHSGCAACEFGVSPLNDPEELGLAIVSDDGRITVVEGAHQTHPEIYNSRFKELQLVAQGEILKQEGKVTWLKTATLQTR